MENISLNSGESVLIGALKFNFVKYSNSSFYSAPDSAGILVSKFMSTLFESSC